jgi:hypothetical protein
MEVMIKDSSMTTAPNGMRPPIIIVVYLFKYQGWRYINLGIGFALK